MSLNGFNTLLVGATGTGKTYSIRSLIDAGITPFVLFTEPGMVTLGDIKCDKLHWKYIPPASPTWDMMQDSASKINTLSLEGLAKLGGINKQGYGQFREVLGTLANFKCDRCGESFGDVTTWGPDRAIVIDSLSGLSIMAMDLVVGSKPVKSMADWGISVDNLERLLNKICADTRCHFILTAHLERERASGRALNRRPFTLPEDDGPIVRRHSISSVMWVHEPSTPHPVIADGVAELGTPKALVEGLERPDCREVEP